MAKQGWMRLHDELSAKTGLLSDDDFDKIWDAMTSQSGRVIEHALSLMDRGYGRESALRNSWLKEAQEYGVDSIPRYISRGMGLCD